MPLSALPQPWWRVPVDDARRGEGPLALASETRR
jgi:hypothetical protein